MTEIAEFTNLQASNPLKSQNPSGAIAQNQGLNCRSSGARAANDEPALSLPLATEMFSHIWAVISSRGTPSPSLNILPSSACASASPCSAAKRNHCTASASSRRSPGPPSTKRIPRANCASASPCSAAARSESSSSNRLRDLWHSSGRKTLVQRRKSRNLDAERHANTGISFHILSRDVAAEGYL